MKQLRLLTTMNILRQITSKCNPFRRFYKSAGLLLSSLQTTIDRLRFPIVLEGFGILWRARQSKIAGFAAWSYMFIISNSLKYTYHLFNLFNKKHWNVNCNSQHLNPDPSGYCISRNNQGALGSRQRHIQAPEFSEETQTTLHVGSNEGEQNNVSLLVRKSPV